MRNVAKVFAHLLATDALPWHVLVNSLFVLFSALHLSITLFKRG